MARDRWPSRLMFIFAAVGSAAGLGNVWRFPYLTYKYGGGAFLIPYFFALLVLGIPLLILEFGLGQHFQRSAVGSLRKLTSWGGIVGWWALTTGFLIITYYAVIMAWALRFFLASASLPWRADAQAFFYHTVLGLTEKISVLGGVNWVLLACLVLVWVMIYFSIFKGVRSVSKVVVVTMPLPFLLILALLVRVVTLPGAAVGITYYLKPLFSALLDPEVWIAAAGQIFFTLTLGFGVMIAYASYVQKGQDVAKDAVWTALLNSLISILAGFVVFGTLGFLAAQKGVLVSDVVASGPGLAFVVFPEALSLMPWPRLFSFLFFLTLLSLGIDSAFSMVEGITAALKERLAVSSQRVALFTSLAAFLGGILYVTGAGLYFLDVIDHFSATYAILLVGLLQTLLVGWTRAGVAVKESLRRARWFPVELWWKLLRFPIPLILAGLLLVDVVKEVEAPYSGYPSWALLFGWSAVLLPLIASWFLNKWYGSKRTGGAGQAA